VTFLYPALANLLASLSGGYILFFFSERLFWTVLWPGTTWPDLAITWLAYSAVAYLFLAVVQWARADDSPSVFLAGAVYGWLIEGGIANTLYGTQDSAPFPMSVSLTALSWHALISVSLGWWVTKRGLAASSSWPLVALYAALGVFWGLWAMFPRQETPPVLVSVERFAAEAFGWTLLLAASWRVVDRASAIAPFRPGWCGMTISAFVVALFYCQHVIAIGQRALIILPALVGGALVALDLHRRRRHGTSAIPRFHAAYRPRRLLALLAMPAVATMTFGMAASRGWDRLPIAATVYQVTGAVGFGLLAAAVAMIIRPQRASGAHNNDA
jgi:hypothetical protein